MRPILFHLPFHVPVYSYGVMLGLSFVVGWYFTLALCERDGMDPKQMGRCAILTIVGALLGARLLYIATNLGDFKNPEELFKLHHGGLVAYGGFLGGFAGSAIFCRLKKISLLAWADCAVPSLCTGLILTRIGCLLYGCDFGKSWDGPWAICFPPGSPAYNQQLTAGLLPSGAPVSLAVHPTQTYESIIGLLLLGLTFLVRRHRRFSGEVFVSFTLGYAVLRYLVETVRADSQRGSVGPFSTSQFVAVATFAAGLILLGWLVARRQKNP